MDGPILASETLYRAVKRSQPDAMTEEGQPTPALFMDEAGVSVDRDGGRSEKTVLIDVKSFFARRFKGLVCFSANLCLENGLSVFPAPTKDNEFHAEIFNDEAKTPISFLNALILSDQACVVAYDKSVEWTEPAHQ